MDPSESDLAILQDPDASELQRQEAFDRLLRRPSGWWGNHPLLTFASACALASSRVLLHSQGLSPDRVDWEAIAQESLLILYTHAGTIRASPRDWLKGVIRNRIRDEIRQSWKEISAQPLSETVAASESDEE